MTTIQQIEKHYDKLTARERFALMVKAGARGDDSQIKTLLQTAPRKIFSYPNTNGLNDGFQFVCMFHMMAILHNLANFYYLLLTDEGAQDVITIGDKSYEFSDVYWLLARAIIGGRDAFAAICQEYGFEAGELLQDYPYQFTITMGELFVTAGAKELTDEEKADLEKYTAETLQGYREAINIHAKGWE